MIRLYILGLIAGLAMGGCAGDVPLIDRVQPAYVKKSDLTGRRWYMRRTVVDVPEDSAQRVRGVPFAMVSIGQGESGALHRLHWFVGEDYLIGYRDHPFAPGTEENPIDVDDPYEGAPVIAFPIASHFDIAREFNPATNEPTNVLVENTIDRPWYERDYMRVSWETTYLGDDDPPWTMPVEYIDNNRAPGGSFYVQPDDATNPYRARLTPHEGYFDFVINHLIQPDPAFCVGTLGFNDPTMCGAGEVKVRYSFMEVDEDLLDGYQPLRFPDSVPVVDGVGQEIHDPATDEVVREPIFERFGYFRLDRRGYDRQRGFVDENRQFRIARFPIWERELDDQGNMIPFAERTVRPIVFHTNWDYPDEFLDVAYDVGAQWNAAFKETVALKLGVSVAEAPDVFLVRQNTCNLANLNAYLNAEMLTGATARRRARLKERVVEAMGGGEPERGTLNHWCSATEYFSADLAVDINEPHQGRFVWEQDGDTRFNLLNWIPKDVASSLWSGYGPHFSDPVTGMTVAATSYVHGRLISLSAVTALEWVDFINGELNYLDVANGLFSQSQLTESGGISPLSFTANMDLAQLNASGLVSEERVAEIDARFRRNGQEVDDFLVPAAVTEQSAARLRALQGTGLEQEVTLPVDLVVASNGAWRPGHPVDPDLVTRASPLTQQLNVMAPQLDAARFLGEQAMCPIAMELDDALLSLAARLRGLTRDERLAEITRLIFRGIALHEIGHNIGLRHNFSGSWDALNFHREFWNVETSGLTETEKAEAGQPEFKESTVMDYYARRTSRFQGLGPYDHAAVKFGYGQLVETFNQPSALAGRALAAWREQNDYRDLVTQLGSVDAMYDRGHAEIDWTDGTLTQSEVDDLAQIEVPYVFCSDRWAGVLPNCRRYDGGANYREIHETSEVLYRNYFIFSNFLRHRARFNFNVTRRAYAPFLNTLQTYRWMYRYRAEDAGFLNTAVGQDMLTATERGLDLMTEVLTTPRVGDYFRCTGTLGEDIYAYAGEIVGTQDLNVGVPLGFQGTCDLNDGIFLGLENREAFPLFLDFTEEDIYFDIAYVGKYWDKLAAINVLTWQGGAFFPRANQALDLREYNVGFFNTYAPELNTLMTDLVLERSAEVGGRFDTANGQFVTRTLVDPSSTMPRVSPGWTRNIPRVAVVNSVAFLSSFLVPELNFAKRARIEIAGSPNDFTDAVWLAAPDRAVAQDPNTGVVYRAIRQPAGELDRGPDVGFELVTALQAGWDEQVAAEAAYDGAVLARDAVLETDPSWPALAQTVNQRDTDLRVASFEAQERAARVRFVLDVLDLLGRGFR